MSVTLSPRLGRLIFCLVVLGGTVSVLAQQPPNEANPGLSTAKHVVRKPVGASSLDDAPSEVREFLGRVLEKIPGAARGLPAISSTTGNGRAGRPTRRSASRRSRALDPRGAGGSRHGRRRLQGEHRPRRSLAIRTRSGLLPPERVRFFQVDQRPEGRQGPAGAGAGRRGDGQGLQGRLLVPAQGQDRVSGPEAVRPQRVQRRGMVRGSGRGRLRTELLAGAGDVNLLQWISLTTGENALAKARRRGQHRRHGGVGQASVGSTTPTDLSANVIAWPNHRWRGW